MTPARTPGREADKPQIVSVGDAIVDFEHAKNSANGWNAASQENLAILL
jgi:hypothetical protein